MAAIGSAWTRPPTALRTVRELLAVTVDLLGWGAGFVLGLVARLGAALLGRRVLRRGYLGPLIERSRTLSGATVTLHGIRSEPQPVGDLPRGHEGRHFHVLDVTVKPRQPRRGAQRWHPRDLTLVAPGAVPASPGEDEEVGRIFRAERWHRGRFVEAHGGPLYGTQRLRLQVGLLPGVRRFHFRYYLELLRRTPEF